MKQLKKERTAQKVLVTGVTGGVGLAVAKIFFESGAELFVTGHNDKNLGHVKEKVFKNSERIDSLAGDLTTADGCKRIVEACEKKKQTIDVLVNCAGVYTEGAAENTTEETWDRIVDTNLKGS